jgi:SAM-dependent methyltransferase
VPGSEPSDSATYDVVRCGRCGTAVTTVVPPRDAYATGLYSPDEPRLARLVRAVMRALLAQVRRLLRAAGLPAGARVVDVGAGSGLLVEALRESGFDAYGIEPAPRGVDRARAAGRPMLPERVEEHEASELDAAILWHVLEHVADPAGALGRVHRWLRPGGLVLVGVPNVMSLQAAIAGDDWFHLDVPRHRTHFSLPGLRALLEQAGFEVVAERHLVVEHNLHGMLFALLGRLGMTPGYPFHLLKRNVPLRGRDLALLLLAGPVLAVPAILLELAAALARRGGTVAVVAQRRS